MRCICGYICVTTVPRVVCDVYQGIQGRSHSPLDVWPQYQHIKTANNFLMPSIVPHPHYPVDSLKLNKMNIRNNRHNRIWEENIEHCIYCTVFLLENDMINQELIIQVSITTKTPNWTNSLSLLNWLIAGHKMRVGNKKKLSLSLQLYIFFISSLKIESCQCWVICIVNEFSVDIFCPIFTV